MNKNTYSSNKAQSLQDKATFTARKKMYDKMEIEIPLNVLKSIIDIGVTADKDSDSSNFFEKTYPFPERITALSDQDASWLVETGINFIQGDALNIPFKDNSFELAFSSAVIEHVGNRKNQLQFIKECIRVSKKYIFITTPNRYYPIELHTTLPFLHWLPSKLYRKILFLIGKKFFSLESNLNLLSKNDIKKMLSNIECKNYKIEYIRFFGFKSNLLIVIKK